ncbi:hypothetical protein XaC1_525 [Xanthomonas phage XaC1]|nr:hypothetical protein XaC1_525 [Xanthomonas phage XaC1]
MIEPTKIIKKLHECIGNIHFEFKRKGESEIWKCRIEYGIQITCIAGVSPCLYIIHNDKQVLFITDRTVAQNKIKIENYHVLQNKDEFFNFIMLNDSAGFNRIDFVRLPEIYEYYIHLFQNRKIKVP